MKYIDTAITFSEVPDEVSLCFSISGCQNHCPACHSKYLWEDTGDELTETVIDSYVSTYKGGITCVCFMGGDVNPQRVFELANHVHVTFSDIKTAWYSGKDTIDLSKIDCMDYIKVGRFDEKFGPLDKQTTNQRMYKKVNGDWEDITYKFWKKKI